MSKKNKICFVCGKLTYGYKCINCIKRKGTKKRQIKKECCDCYICRCSCHERNK